MRKFEYINEIIEKSYNNAEPINFELPKRSTKNSARI